MFIKPPKVIKYIDGIHAKYKPNYKTTGHMIKWVGNYLPDYYEKYK